MSIAFPIIATVVLAGATALGLWVDRQTSGPAWQEWRDRR